MQLYTALDRLKNPSQGVGQKFSWKQTNDFIPLINYLYSLA